MDKEASIGAKQPSHQSGPQSKKGTSNVAKIQLCSEHGNNIVPDMCNACQGVTRMVKQDMTRQLMGHGGLPNTSSIPSPADRLLGKRIDEVEPTLVFSLEELETAD